MTIEKSRFNSEAAPQSCVSQKKIPQAVKGDISVMGAVTAVQQREKQQELAA